MYAFQPEPPQLLLSALGAAREHERVICTAAPLPLITAARGHAPNGCRSLRARNTNRQPGMCWSSAIGHTCGSLILNLRSIYASQDVSR